MGVSPGLEEKVDNIVSTLREMLSRRQMASVCGICATEGHPNDLCPYLRESGQEVVNAEPAPASSSMSMEDMTRDLTLSVTHDRADNKQNFKNLENQVSQLATAINQLEARDSNALPSQTVVNPRENVSAVSLRNGRQLVEIEKTKAKPKVVTIHEKEEEIVIEEDEKASNVKEKEQISSSIPKVEADVPFPDALKRTHHFDHDKDIYENDRISEVNIPLLNLLKSVPKYAKFLKELCTIKRNNKLKGMKKVKGKGSKGEIISEYVSALFQKKVPPKCGDPGMFSIHCTIGDLRFEKAMLDLGASINVISFTIYETLKLGPLKDTSVVVQLADRSSVYPKGIVENVMVGVGKLAFLADFYVLDMKNEADAIPVLLGRPFLRTAGTKIDVPKGIGKVGLGSAGLCSGSAELLKFLCGVEEYCVVIAG
ncbi:uncharacterized protein LOC141632802 [Silene latifolia]|uniref:uncharacterized protein LOC141632802 n=1 Tax=Silene latifolia TaxID=37657 RepID=UPI003D785518